MARHGRKLNKCPELLHIEGADLFPLSDLAFLTENFAVGPKQMQEAERWVHETWHDGTAGQKN